MPFAFFIVAIVIGLLVALLTLACVFTAPERFATNWPWSFTVIVEPSTFAATLICETPLASLVGVTVTPLPASNDTLSLGLIKPTLTLFACRFQPLVLIAFATFFAVTKPSLFAPVGTWILPLPVALDKSVVFTLNFTTPLSSTTAVVCVPLVKSKPLARVTLFALALFAL